MIVDAESGRPSKMAWTEADISLSSINALVIFSQLHREDCPRESIACQCISNAFRERR